jgi:hypothetical protein
MGRTWRAKGGRLVVSVDCFVDGGVFPSTDVLEGLKGETHNIFWMGEGKGLE